VVDTKEVLMRLVLALTLTTVVLAAGEGCRSEPKAADPAALVAKLKSPDTTVSGAASLELLRLGEPATPALVELLHDTDPVFRALAARTLWGMGAKAGGAAIPPLADALGDVDGNVRLTAAMALENMGPLAAPAVPALIRALHDADAKVRPWAARALGSIGPAAEAAVPALQKAGRLDGVQGPAEEAIQKIRAR
jgi:HEAT repeat protein